MLIVFVVKLFNKTLKQATNQQLSVICSLLAPAKKALYFIKAE